MIKLSVRTRLAHNRIAATATMVVIGVHFSAITGLGSMLYVMILIKENGNLMFVAEKIG
jgi:hypothetical protein